MPKRKKGLKGWIEIFKGGKQKDSAGKVTEFTEDDVESLVTNHEPAPHVVGHPKDTSPAYGWTEKLKRDGLRLFAKSNHLNADFEEAVENKSFPNRSVRIRKVNNGYKVVHVGWLGGVAPAIKGLEPAFSEFDDNGMDFTSNWETGWSIERIGKAFRNIRDWLIEKEGKETADQVLPDWDVESIKDAGKDIQNSPDPVIDPIKPEPVFKEKDMPDKNFTQADIDAAKKAVALEYQTKLDTANQTIETSALAERNERIAAHIEGWKTEGKVTKANEAGLKAFMETIASDEKEFEFSQGDGTKKQKAEDWFCEFMKAQKPMIDLDKTRANTDVNTKKPTQAEIHQYMKDNDCGSADAVFQLSENQQGEA